MPPTQACSADTKNTLSLSVTTSPLLLEIVQVDARKGLISKIDATLLSSIQGPASLKCRAKWVANIGDIDGDQWDMALESIPAISISASHRLSQLFILHRAYRTPERLYDWGIKDSPLCPKCKAQLGDFIHMIWRCPKRNRYWTEVMQYISSLAQVPVPNNPLSMFARSHRQGNVPEGNVTYDH